MFIVAAYGSDGTPDAMNAAWGGISDTTERFLCLSAGHKTTKHILERRLVDYDPQTGRHEQLAAVEDRAQLVRNVHQFPGHIACGSAASSEIVAPIHAGGRGVGALDLDSPRARRFPVDACDGPIL